MPKRLIESYIKNYIILEAEERDDQESSSGSDSEPPTFGHLQAILGKVRKHKSASNKISFLGSAIKRLTIGSALESELAEVASDEVLKKLKDKGFDLQKYMSKPGELLLKLYGLNDEEGLKKLELPDNVSNLVDDKIEKDFVNWLLGEINNENENSVIEDNWVLKKFREYTLKVNPKTQRAVAVTQDEKK